MWHRHRPAEHMAQGEHLAAGSAEALAARKAAASLAGGSLDEIRFRLG